MPSGEADRFSYSLTSSIPSRPEKHKMNQYAIHWNTSIYLQTFKIHHQFLENIAYSSIAPHLWTCACPQFAMIHSSNRGASSCHVEYVHHLFLVQIDMATRQGCRLANVRPQLCEYSCVNTATGWQLDGCLLKVCETERKNVANITSFGAENEGFWLYQLRSFASLN